MTKQKSLHHIVIEEVHFNTRLRYNLNTNHINIYTTHRYQKEYYKNNKDKRKECDKQYYEKHKIKLKQCAKQYRNEHKIEAKQYAKQYL